jgi:hypothetical protein
MSDGFRERCSQRRSINSSLSVTDKASIGNVETVVMKLIDPAMAFYLLEFSFATIGNYHAII